VAGGAPGYLRYPVRVPVGRRPAVLSVSLDLGVVATYPTTLAALPAIQERRVDREDLPGADTLVAELITLPTHGRVRPLEADRIAKVVAGQGFWPAARPAGQAP
jgi:dTDP-4-amino-4,6-dideoxygalactose transaminase